MQDRPSLVRSLLASSGSVSSGLTFIGRIRRGYLAFGSVSQLQPRSYWLLSFQARLRSEKGCLEELHTLWLVLQCKNSMLYSIASFD